MGAGDGKTAVVTGANAGLGRGIAEALAADGWRVVMVCRDRGRGEAARDAIRKATGRDDVALELADLASIADVARVADAIAATYGRVDLLVNNAGVYKQARTLTGDGLETMFAVNHLAPFLLTTRLLPVIPPDGRIATIAAPSTTNPDLADLQGEKGWSALTAFGASKAANLVFTAALARRTGGRPAAIAVHPGLVKSDLMHEAPAPIRFLAGLVSRSPQAAGRAVATLLTDPGFAGWSGKLVKAGGKVLKAASFVEDAGMQAGLWERSEALVKKTSP